MVETELDLKRQKEAKRYSHIRHRLILIDTMIGGVYALAWLYIGWSKQLKESLLRFTTNDWMLVAGFGIIFGGIYYLLTLPLSYYEGFLLHHRFGMSNQSRSEWIVDQAKGLGIGLLLGGMILEIIYTVLRAAPDTWWIFAGLILLFLNVLLANLAPVILFPIFYKFEPLEDDYQQLADRLIHLASEANT
jgi:STE24 endopeptidase